MNARSLYGPSGTNAPDVGNVYDGVCFALGHVLDDMYHHDARSFAVSNGRCLPARCHGRSVTETSTPADSSQWYRE